MFIGSIVSELREFKEEKKNDMDKWWKLLIVIILGKSNILAHYLVCSFVLTYICIVL